MPTTSNTEKYYTVVSGGSFGSGYIDLRGLSHVRVSNTTLTSGASMYTGTLAKAYTVRMEHYSELTMDGGYIQHAGIVGGQLTCLASAQCIFLTCHESGKIKAYGTTSLTDVAVYDGGHMCLKDKATAHKVNLDPNGTVTIDCNACISHVFISSGATMTMYNHSYAELVEIHSGGSLVLLDNAKATDVILHSGGFLDCCDKAEYVYHRDTPTKLPSTVPYKRTTCTASAEFYADGKVLLKIPDLAVKGGTMSIVIEGKDTDAEKA